MDNLLSRVLLTLTYLLIAVSAEGCYFPIEYQGTFLIQTQAQKAENISLVSYAEITVDADAIPPWGRCHKRLGNNVILADSTAGAEDCMRCFHLSMKSPNVIQLHSEGIERCYTNEEAARATCPSDKDVADSRTASKKFNEIVLYRKHIPGGLQSIQHVFCPFNGKYRFDYVSGQNDELQCHDGYSEMSNCPHGNALNVKFRKCTFPTIDINFLCLGDWESSTPNERYVALMDIREDPETRPRYRCGMYREDARTGKITVSLSADSTCNNQLYNATSGYESLTLTPAAKKRLPSMVESAKCRFPDWTQGSWQDTKVEGNRFTYKDQKNQFRTVNARCLRRQTDGAQDRFVVHTITQCGEQSYSCLWMKRRSPNIMEFKFSDKSSSVFSEKLCDDRNFAESPNDWITEGKKIVAQTTACPIMGDYTGVVPGTSDLCAKVASDCNNPDIMFYSVSSCENRSHVYEEREYRCLGNWEEDGVLYTFTKRRDMPGHQCFAGIVMRNGEEAFIREAGEMNCIRDGDPMIHGMKINKQASCPRILTVPPYIAASQPKQSLRPPMTSSSASTSSSSPSSSQSSNNNLHSIPKFDVPIHHETRPTPSPIPIYPAVQPKPSSLPPAVMPSVPIRPSSAQIPNNSGIQNPSRQKDLFPNQIHYQPATGNTFKTSHVARPTVHNAGNLDPYRYDPDFASPRSHFKPINSHRDYNRQHHRTSGSTSSFVLHSSYLISFVSLLVSSLFCRFSL